MGIITLNQDEVKVVSGGISLPGWLSLWGGALVGVFVTEFIDSRLLIERKSRRLLFGPYAMIVVFFASVSLFVAEKFFNSDKSKFGDNDQLPFRTKTLEEAESEPL